MPDFILTKDDTRATGQLPDKLTIVLRPNHAWLIVKQLLIQLEQGNRAVSVDIYGMVEKAEK